VAAENDAARGFGAGDGAATRFALAVVFGRSGTAAFGRAVSGCAIGGRDRWSSAGPLRRRSRGRCALEAAGWLDRRRWAVCQSSPASRSGPGAPRPQSGPAQGTAYGDVGTALQPPCPPLEGAVASV